MIGQFPPVDVVCVDISPVFAAVGDWLSVGKRGATTTGTRGFSVSHLLAATHTDSRHAVVSEYGKKVARHSVLFGINSKQSTSVKKAATVMIATT